MILQPINDIAAICALHGIEEAILCPGSRSAPLTLAFVRHPGIRTRTITDERSAAFIGLGIAQQTRKPVVLVCTSGTAALNFAPAIGEAFYQQIPLLVLTADRPPEWIDQHDGQAIKQQNLYGGHTKKSYQIPVDLSHPDAAWHTNRIVNEAINLTQQFPPGPVHINVPFREPFYPLPDEPYHFSENPRIIKQWQVASSLTENCLSQLQEIIGNSKKIVVIAGLHAPDKNLQEAINGASQGNSFVFIPDITSNLTSVPNAILNPDRILSGITSAKEKALQPDLLITFGGPVVSKNLKQYFRKNPPAHHLHIQPSGGDAADVYQCLSDVLNIDACSFFEEYWPKLTKQISVDNEFVKRWQQAEIRNQNSISDFLFQAPFGEFAAVKKLLEQIPEESILQIGNSMPIRYVSICYTQNRNLEIYCNRGTSGIDGSLSTAVGATLSTNKTVTALLGDLSFFYDRNGLWHNYLPPNLKIVVLNNHGGGIFDIINGPAQQPEAAEYFITRQRLTAELTAQEAGMPYFCATSYETLQSGLEQLYKTDGAALLEIQSQQPLNTEIFIQYQQLNQHEPDKLDTH